MEANKLDINTLCRTCMSEDTNMKSVYFKRKDERPVTELLQFVTNISINSDDNLPKQVCNECESFLYKADYFKRRCLDVELKLKKLFSDECSSTMKPRIKHEDESKGSTFDAEGPYQCSICYKKYAETSLLENHVLDCHKLEVALPSDLTLFSNATPVVATLEIIPEKEENEAVVKIEYNDEIDDDSQYNDFSIHDTEPLETEFAPKIDNSDVNIIIENNIHIDNKSTDKVKKKSHECEKCNRQFKSALSLNIHKRKHEEKLELEKKYQCSFCMRKFVSKSAMTNHLRIHESKDDIKYTCGSCKREFKHKAHLDNHMVTMHPNVKGFGCDFCFKNFATQESLEIHKDLHKIEKRYTCQYCKKSFYMLSTLTDHIRTHTGEKPYLCSTCGRGFSQKTNLTQHMRRHLGLKPFACDQCTHRFVSKGELVAHARKHSGAHPFVCDECGNGFTTSSSLVKHRRTHSGERPYACDLCHMRFAASGTLKNHRRTHTGEKPYQCNLCEKAFVQKNDLVSHIRCHTGERPYVCGACGGGFRKPAALRHHARTHCARARPQPAPY